MWQKPTMRARYVPDLDRRLAGGTQNYQRFMRLLPPDWAVGAQLCIHMAKMGRLYVQLESQSAYTSSISLRQQYLNHQPWLSKNTMLVRIYHDVQLAEVISFGGHVLSDGASLNTYQSSIEQQQLDDLLSEWLTLSLQY